MSDFLKTFQKQLSQLLQTRGAKSELCRKAGISRTILDRWLSGENTPTLDTLERIASGLDVQPWELIKPDGALPTKPTPSPTMESLLKVIENQEDRLKQIEGIPTEVIAALKKCSPSKMLQVLIVLGLKSVLTDEDRAPINKKKTQTS